MPDEFEILEAQPTGNAAKADVRPDLPFMRAHAARWIALAFGAGLAPFAPGTFGTLWAWAVFVFLSQWVDSATWGWIIALSTLVGWWACTLTARDLRIADPSCVVWDEVLAFWLILWLIAPAGFWAQLVAFLLFRYFDAAKPQPVRWADQAFKGGGWRGGFGIIFDDFVAAFCTLLVIALWRYVAG